MPLPTSPLLTLVAGAASAAAAGEALWPRLADAYVQHYVQPAVAACAADSGEVADLLDAAAGLEEWAESLGLLEGAWRRWWWIRAPIPHA